jgi:phosphoribosylaminoimidazole-succinocarboxamide synthase
VISTSQLPLIHAGKVRRLYALDDPNQILIVATDAISAYDQVLQTPIPDKGAILTQLSVWWTEQLRDIVPTHLISTDVPVDVQGRAIVAERLEMVPVECIARGYITGSGWAEYQVSGTVNGIPLPPGLQHADRLPEPIFTPTTKAPQGEHDAAISYGELVTLVGADVAEQLRDLTLQLYARGARLAAERDIILADTKFEFGRRADGTIVLADEVLTPDSSRFWDATQWTPGAQVPSFDKQYVRDWLAYDSGWDKNSDAPAPALPRSVVEATRDRYLEAHARLTGRQFAPPAKAPATPASLLHEAAARYQPKTRYIVDVMPKPEILDPQGKAVTSAITRMGYNGYSVRQGKRFEVETTRSESPETLAEIQAFAEALLANTVIENFAVSVDRPGVRATPAPAPVPAPPPAPAPAAEPPAPVPPAPVPVFTPEPVPAPAAPAPAAPPAAEVVTAPEPVVPEPAVPEPAVPEPEVPEPVADVAVAAEAGPVIDTVTLSSLSSELAHALEALQATAKAMAQLSGDVPPVAPPAAAPAPEA